MRLRLAMTSVDARAWEKAAGTANGMVRQRKETLDEQLTLSFLWSSADAHVEVVDESESVRSEAARYEAESERARRELGRPFARADELDKARARLASLSDTLHHTASGPATEGLAERWTRAFEQECEALRARACELAAQLGARLLETSRRLAEHTSADASSRQGSDLQGITLRREQRQLEERHTRIRSYADRDQPEAQKRLAEFAAARVMKRHPELREYERQRDGSAPQSSTNRSKSRGLGR